MTMYSKCLNISICIRCYTILLIGFILKRQQYALEEDHSGQAFSS